MNNSNLLESISSPCFVLEEEKLIDNLKLLNKLGKDADIDILMALKAFALWESFPLIKKYLNGATASSLNEALLVYNEFGFKAHTYSVAFSEKDFKEILACSSHIIFNSIDQYKKFLPSIKNTNCNISIGLRVNPGWSDVDVDLYNPSAPTSRLGVAQLEYLPEHVEGFHFHVLCESNSYSLAQVLESFEWKFGKYLKHLKWINIGGGHNITDHSYDYDHLVRLLKSFRDKHGIKLFMEPGSAIAWKTGYLVSTILDIVDNGGTKTAICDISFTCHMPDCLEMPYKPNIMGASLTQGKYKYNIGGVSCLAGDFMNDFYFEKELGIGDRIIFEDMMHYTMVKTSMFNGVTHPSIGKIKKDGTFKLIRVFNFDDFKHRLS